MLLKALVVIDALIAGVLSMLKLTRIVMNVDRCMDKHFKSGLANLKAAAEESGGR